MQKPSTGLAGAAEAYGRCGAPCGSVAGFGQYRCRDKSKLQNRQTAYCIYMRLYLNVMYVVYSHDCLQATCWVVQDHGVAGIFAYKLLSL